MLVKLKVLTTESAVKFKQKIKFVDGDIKLDDESVVSLEDVVSVEVGKGGFTNMDTFDEDSLKFM